MLATTVSKFKSKKTDWLTRPHRARSDDGERPPTLCRPTPSTCFHPIRKCIALDLARGLPYTSNLIRPKCPTAFFTQHSVNPSTSTQFEDSMLSLCSCPENHRTFPWQSARRQPVILYSCALLFAFVGIAAQANTDGILAGGQSRSSYRHGQPAAQQIAELVLMDAGLVRCVGPVSAHRVLCGGTVGRGGVLCKPVSATVTC
jgi:hypothetical protein